ncbi:MAG: hypothetical protein WD534_15650 [Phycisphaeraceae bacterium]
MNDRSGMNHRRIRVAQFGLGPIGLEAVRLAASRGWLEVVGGVDIDTKKVVQSLGALTGDAALNDAPVVADFEQLWQQAKPDVVLHTAGSSAAQTAEQIEPMLARGVSVASTCEQMLYPWLRAPEAADRLDAVGREHDARVVGTGVNPGFVLDLLPVCVSGVCRSVQRVYGERVVNASTRREPLQRKVGSGMEPAAFRQRFAEGKAGHAGFQESLALIAHALGWPIGAIEETCDAVVTARSIRTQYFAVEPGLTCGLHQIVRAATADGRTIELDLKMYLDAPNPHDAIHLDADPPVDLILPGGVAGDTATVAALINAIPPLLAARPGVRLMTELGVSCCAEALAGTPAATVAAT